MHVISGVAETREAALALLGKYRDRHFVERAFEMAWFESQEVLRLLNMTEADAQIYGRLATSVIYANAVRRASPSIIARNQLGQSGLWRFGISGDLPIVLVRIGDVNRIDLVKQALQAHAYWRIKGLAADLVILNEDFSGYRAVLHDRDHGPDKRRARSGRRRQAGRRLRPAGGRAFRRGPGAVPDRRPRRAHRHGRDPGRAGAAPRAGRAPARPPRALAAPDAETRSSPCRRARASSTTAWAASPRTAANTSSAWNPVRARRRPGRTSSPARTSGRSSARTAAPTPGWRTPTSSA